MVGRIKQLLSIRPGEAGLVFLLGILLMGNSAALAVSDVVSVSGFLSEVGINELLIVWLIDMVLVILATGVQSLLVDRFNRLSLLRWMSFGFALIYVVLRMMFVFRVSSWINYSILFLLTEQQWLFFPLIFWILATDIFDTAQSKRLFPVIAAGHYVGRILGLGIAAIAPQLLDRLDISSTELLSMNVLIYLLIYLLISEGLRNVSVTQRPAQQESVREALTEGWGFVREVPSFRYLMLAMLGGTIAFTIIEFHFLKVISTDTTFSDAGSFQTFYSLFNLGATLAAILVQTLLTSRIINRFGLKNTFMVFPALLTAGVTMLLIFPLNLISVVAGLFFPRLSKFTVDDPARKSFQSLVPEERRGRVSMFMDSYLFAGGAIIGSLILGLIALLETYRHVANAHYIYLGIAAITAVLSISFIFRMRAVYDASMLNWRLKRRKRVAGANVLDKLDF